MITTKTKYTTIKQFTIYGERCSGTNYLEKVITNSFNIPITFNFSHKHFFGHTPPSLLSSAQNTLFIGIVRNPFNWIQSFYKEKYHVPMLLRKNLDNFLTMEWYSENDDHTENLFDRNYISKKRYKNIFEMRNAKNAYLINYMPRIVNNYFLINYDLMLTDQMEYLKHIAQTFNLKLTKYQPEVKIKPWYYTYKKHYHLICNNLNWKYENIIGFYKELYPKEYIVNS
jgi:hypothetical protein